MYLYENAIITDINKLFKNSTVRAVIADSLDEGLRRIAAEKEDKITLPVIVLVGGDWELGDSNFYSLFHGSEVGRTYEGKGTKNMNIMPFTPQYTINICASSSRECDMLTREILFHYSTNPTLVVNIPYGLDEIHTFNIYFNKSIRKQQKQSGLVYRTVSFTIQGAYLWHNNTYNVLTEVETNVKEEFDLDVQSQK